MGLSLHHYSRSISRSVDRSFTRTESVRDLSLDGLRSSFRDELRQSIQDLVLAQCVDLCGQDLASIDVKPTDLPSVDLGCDSRVDLALPPRLLPQIMESGEVPLHRNSIPLCLLYFLVYQVISEQWVVIE